MQIATRDVQISVVSCVVGMLVHWAWQNTDFQWRGTPVMAAYQPPVVTSPPVVVQPAPPVQVASSQAVVSSSAHPITGASQPPEEWTKKNCKFKDFTTAPDGRQIRNYTC